MSKSLKSFVIEKIYPQACKSLHAEIDGSTKPSYFKENDGNNVLLKLTSNFRIVQVINVTGQRDSQGIRLTISDGEVFFNSIITDHCAIRFKADSGQPATELQINSLIRLEDYDLRLGFRSSKTDEYFNFIVRKFHVIGNEGGPRYRDPQPIQDHNIFPDLSKLLSECRKVTPTCSKPAEMPNGALNTSGLPPLLDTALQDQDDRGLGACSGNGKLEDVKGPQNYALTELLDATKLSRYYELIGTQDTNELQRILRKATDASGENEKSTLRTTEIEDVNHGDHMNLRRPSPSKIEAKAIPSEHERNGPLTATELWAGLNLTKTEFRIPHDQKKLLAEGKRHWIPRPVGRQSSMVKVIPERALCEFTKFIDTPSKVNAAESSSLHEKDNQDVEACSGSPLHAIEKVNSEPEEDCANSSDWPESPIRVALGHGAATQLPKTSFVEELSSETSSIGDSHYSEQLPPDSEDEIDAVTSPAQHGNSKPKSVTMLSLESWQDEKSSEAAVIKTCDDYSVSPNSATLTDQKLLQNSPNESNLNVPATEISKSAIKPAPNSEDYYSARGLSLNAATEHTCSPPETTCGTIEPSDHSQHKFNQSVEELAKATASLLPPPPKFLESRNGDMSDSDSDIETSAPIALKTTIHGSSVGFQSTPCRSGPSQTFVQVKETPFADFSTRPQKSDPLGSRALIPASLEERPMATSEIEATVDVDSAAQISLHPVQTPRKATAQSSIKAKNLKRSFSDVDFGVTKAKRSHIRIDPSKFTLSSQPGEDPAINYKQLKKSYMSDLGQKRKSPPSNCSDAASEVRLTDEIADQSEEYPDPSIAAAEFRRQFLKTKTRASYDTPVSSPKRPINNEDVAALELPISQHHVEMAEPLSTQECEHADGNSPLDGQTVRSRNGKQSYPIARTTVREESSLVDSRRHGDQDEHAGKDDGDSFTRAYSSCHSMSGVGHESVQKSSTHVDMASQSSDTSLPHVDPAFQELFHSFKAAYGDYDGDLTHFNSMINAIRSNHTIDTSYWDDYIVRHRRYYKDYVNECLIKGREPLLYWEYWCKFRSSTDYAKKITTPISISVVGEEPFHLGGEMEVLSTLCSKQDKTYRSRADILPATTRLTASRGTNTEQLHTPLKSPGYKETPQHLQWSSESKLSSCTTSNPKHVSRDTVLVQQAEHHQSPTRTPIRVAPDSASKGSRNGTVNLKSPTAPPPYSAHVPRISPNGAIHKPSLKSKNLENPCPSSTSKTIKGTRSPRGWLDAKKLHKGISIFANFARKRD